MLSAKNISIFIGNNDEGELSILEVGDFAWSPYSSLGRIKYSDIFNGKDKPTTIEPIKAIQHKHCISSRLKDMSQSARKYKQCKIFPMGSL